MTRVLLFSSDCHIGLVRTSYPEYFDPKYQEQLEELLSAERNRPYQQQNKVSAGANEAMRDQLELRGILASQPEKRIAALEEDGFVGEVLFPDSGHAGADNAIPFAGYFGGIGDFDPDLHAAALRAYNRWLGEASVAGRQIGVGLIPLRDAEYAAAQAKTLRLQGLRGAMPAWDGTDPDFAPLYDAGFDPMWAALAEDQLVVNFHQLAGVPHRMYAAQGMNQAWSGVPGGRLTFGAEALFWSRRPLWQMIFGGVLERHPNLRVGFAELYSDWVPRTLDYMDWIWDTKSGEDDRQVCRLRPSEYWARQCFTAASPMSLREAEQVGDFAPGTLTYGTDFPHSISAWGKYREYLQATVGAARVPEAEARKILGENAVAIYDLDLTGLRSVAERVGPTIDEILNVPVGVDPTESLRQNHRDAVNRPLSML